jgi:hypothetical protein
MSRYFKFFPKIPYSLDSKLQRYDTVVNLIARYSFNPEFAENTAAFYKYEVKDGETPETIAYKFYDSAERHWIILVFNGIIDPQYDWPMSYRNLNDYIDKKYSEAEYADTSNTGIPGLVWAKNNTNVKSYFKTIQQTNEDGSSNTIKIEIDQSTYNSVIETTITYNVDPITGTLDIVDSVGGNSATLTIGNDLAANLDIVKIVTVTRDRQTYYDYENELNESKRTIKLLRKEFIYPIEEEFKKKVNDGII